MATGYDDSSVITDDSFFDKPTTQNGNTATHDVTTKNETSKVVLSFYDVMMDFNLCCSTRHDDDETVVAGSTRKTSCQYAQAEISLPNKKYNNNKIQEEEQKEEVEIEQEKVMSNNNNNTTLADEENKKKCSRVNRLYKSTSSIQKVNSRQSATTTTTHLSSSCNQKENKSNMTDWIQKSLSLQKKINSLRKTMSKAASVPTTTKKKKKKPASDMMTKGTFSFKKTNRNRNKIETASQDSYNTAGLSSFVKQMHRMGYSRSVTTKQNHTYDEIRTK